LQKHRITETCQCREDCVSHEFTEYTLQLEQAAEQQAQAQTASWGPGPGLTQRDAGLCEGVQGVAEPLSSPRSETDECSEIKKGVLRSRRGGRKHKKATTQQKGAVHVQTASPVQSPRGDKLVHLAETDEAAQRMRSGVSEGWAIRCGAGGAATPITAAETIAEEDSRKAGFDPSLQTLWGDVPDPKSVAEALSRPDRPEWANALLGEVGSCLELGFWEDCELPPGKQALPSQFIMERKRDGRYKVRLVAEGHRQQHGVDFEETYELVCSYRTMCMILAVSAREGFVMRQFDIRTAFLNGELEEEVYMRPPAGAEGLAGGGSRVLHLKRALYGLRQASRA
jgi:hypothetical protein